MNEVLRTRLNQFLYALRRIHNPELKVEVCPKCRETYLPGVYGVEDHNGHTFYVYLDEHACLIQGLKVAGIWLDEAGAISEKDIRIRK